MPQLQEPLADDLEPGPRPQRGERFLNLALLLGGRTSRTFQHTTSAAPAMRVATAKNDGKPKRRIMSSPKSGASEVETSPESPKMPRAQPRRSTGTISTTWM